MSGQIRLKESSSEKEIAAHVLPCHIAYDGISKVSDYFRPQADPNDQTRSACAFRGRKLCGRTISLPDGYLGIMARRASTEIGHIFRAMEPTTQFAEPRCADENDDEDIDVEKTNWQSEEKFDKLTIWEHQAIPDEKQDQWIRAIEEWVAMADVVTSIWFNKSNARWLPQDTNHLRIQRIQREISRE